MAFWWMEMEGYHVGGDAYLVAVEVGGLRYFWVAGGWRSMGEIGMRERLGRKKIWEKIVRILHLTKLKPVRTTGRTLY